MVVLGHVWLKAHKLSSAHRSVRGAAAVRAAKAEATTTELSMVMLDDEAVIDQIRLNQNRGREGQVYGEYAKSSGMRTRETRGEGDSQLFIYLCAGFAREASAIKRESSGSMENFSSDHWMIAFCS